ncbi:replication protein A 70 kDa DNA-binding subunit B [Tanacetum coccineum]
MEINMTQLCDLDFMLDDALARVISIWMSHPKQRPNEMWRLDAVLQDQMGNRVQATVRNQDIKKFQPILDEGACYRISNFGVDENGGNIPLLDHRYKLSFFKNTALTRVGIFYSNPRGFRFEHFGAFTSRKLYTSLGYCCTPDSSQQPPQDCVKCGNPVEGPNCQGCALWRKKLKEVWFKICHESGLYQDFLNTYESSDDDTNVVNAPREPFVVKQDPGENSSQSLPLINQDCCYECGDSLEKTLINMSSNAKHATEDSKLIKHLICTKEFETKQALGGHMNIHRFEKGMNVVEEKGPSQQEAALEKVESDLESGSSVLTIVELERRKAEEDERVRVRREMVLAAKQLQLFLD